ncbi:hypothetical protein CsSME_00008998 [Camellia sinensis var. sinensis]
MLHNFCILSPTHSNQVTCLMPKGTRVYNQRRTVWPDLPQHPPFLDEKEKKIRELTAELESTNQRCEVYRANLLAVLRDMEDQKLKLSVKVQNARLSLKE